MPTETTGSCPDTPQGLPPEAREQYLALPSEDRMEVCKRLAQMARKAKSRKAREF